MLVKIIFGLSLGYLIATWAESFFHQHLGHASPRLRSFWARFPLIGTPFLAAFYGHHIVHHALTFRTDFVTQFESDSEREMLDEKLPTPWKKTIIADHYGVTLRGSSNFLFVLPITPFAPLIYFLFGPWVMFSAAIPMFVVYPMMSKWIHPLIHKAEMNILETCTPLERWIMNTRYMKAVVRDHFLHHDYVTCNYNLLRGGDYLRFVHRDTTTAEQSRMRAIGL
jgi:hypothetical protein